MKHPARLLLPLIAFEFILAGILLPAKIPATGEGCTVVDGVPICHTIDISYPYMPAVSAGIGFLAGGLILSYLVVEDEREIRKLDAKIEAGHQT